jgi:hypothetical protein
VKEVLVVGVAGDAFALEKDGAIVLDEDSPGALNKDACPCPALVEGAPCPTPGLLPVTEGISGSDPSVPLVLLPVPFEPFAVVVGRVPPLLRSL